MVKKHLNNFCKATKTWWPFALIIVLFFVRCSEPQITKPEGEIAAEVGDYFLTENELVKVFGEDWKNKQDKVNDFIRIWAKDKVIAKEAERTLSERDKDFRVEITSYKNSLLKYAYEKKLLDSILSQDVSQPEIEEYFQANKKNFELKENIVRVRYVKVPKKHKKLNKIKYMIQYKDSVSQEKFFNLIQKNNLFCEANDSLWQKLDDLKNLIPFKLYNDEHFLRNYKYTEAPDGEDVWIIYFTENRLKKGVAPIEMVNDQIKAIMLNQRKQELIQKKENAIYDKALKNKEVKIYVNEE